MPRYVIQRRLGNISEEDLHEAALHAKKIREERFPEVSWEHTHVTHTDSGLVTYCIYAAPNPDMVRDHAQAAGLPVDSIEEILLDLAPEEL